MNSTPTNLIDKAHLGVYKLIRTIATFLTARAERITEKNRFIPLETTSTNARPGGLCFCCLTAYLIVLYHAQHQESVYFDPCCLKFKPRGRHCRTIYWYSNFPYRYLVLEKLHRNLPIYRYTVTPLSST